MRSPVIKKLWQFIIAGKFVYTMNTRHNCGEKDVLYKNVNTMLKMQFRRRIIAKANKVWYNIYGISFFDFPL